jgi:hypothetical protein
MPSTKNNNNIPLVAKFVESSDNRKICSKPFKVSTTYVSVEASCPATCQLRKEGSCYSFSGPIAIHLKALNENYTKAASKRRKHPILISADRAAVQEAQLIEASFEGKETIPQDGPKGGRDLRIHGFGDARTKRAARRLGDAASHWVSRKGGQPWTYTHAWKTVPRRYWGSDISVLASLDNISDIQAAQDAGYAVAVVVDTFKNGSKAWEDTNGNKFIPCPSQVSDGKVSCVKCRLCLRDSYLKENKLIVTFSAHGGGSNKIKRRLSVVNNNANSNNNKCPQQ